MMDTLSSGGILTPMTRHWVTLVHSGDLALTACGQEFGTSLYPLVQMPTLCLTCETCKSQREAYDLAMLTAEVAR